MNEPRKSSHIAWAAARLVHFLGSLSNGRLYRVAVLLVVGACSLYGLTYAPSARAVETYASAVQLCTTWLHGLGHPSLSCHFIATYNRQIAVGTDAPGQNPATAFVSGNVLFCSSGSLCLVYPLAQPLTCPSAGTSRHINLPKYYAAPGPFYSTIPGTPCQCIFYMRASWQDTAFGGPGTTTGTCTGTGRFIGDDAGDPSPPPALPESPSEPPPNPCDNGGLSCYDGPGNRWCYGSGGKQVCVPGPDGPTDPNPGQTPQNCAQGDGVAICAGSPDAPSPAPKPDGDPLGDTDYTTSDGAGAPPANTQVITWDTTGQGNNSDPGDGSSSTGSTGNGGNNGSQGEADGTGKCADGSVPSAGGCGAGYSDNGCDAPPTCSGDPLLCASLREQHATRCAAAKARKPFELTGDAAVDDAAIDAAVAAGTPTFEPGCLWNCIGEDGDGDPGDPDDGSSKLEVTRFWGPRHECPGVPDPGIPGLESFGAQVSAPLCQTTGTWGMIILALGYAFGTIAFARTLAAG